MAEQFLHGIEVLELTTGTRPIQTVRSGVVGLVGTAPAAQPAVAAVRVLGTDNSGLVLTAKTAGISGNQISIALVNPMENSAVLGVVATGTMITVNLATSGAGAITSTAAQIKTAIEANATANALITVAFPSGGNGTGVVTAATAGAFAGGADEPFPLNTPVLIAGNQIEAAALGNQGTLPWAIDGIFDQVGAMVVVVRVASNALPATEQANVIGGVSGSGQYEGIKALLGAKSQLGVTPKILIAPGYSHNQAL